MLAKIHRLRRTSTLALRQRKAALWRRLAIPPHFLRASYVQRFTTCGKANCACVQGHKHGPFYYLASGLTPGHVLKFLLKTPDQQRDGRQGVARVLEILREEIEITMAKCGRSTVASIDSTVVVKAPPL